MKLLLVTALKAYKRSISKIMEQSGINAFSITETSGFKGEDSSNLLDSWFASGDEFYDSIFLFSFTEEAKAEAAMHFIMDHNANVHPKFPIRAFIMPVEKASH
ncbi:hypothetical protein GO730_31435 [Spirosoma sp. HMF3257]|uniref:DUF3240 domain-containing protein n=1 Tax=Spirosoma telluris TaxID=2183553 RepID=A0A327NUK2_9BACT|nr:hypothetical protein [Spirosoma telluris]RAI77534.1 hypothetical protein HMF3257_31330 [Spirosoma telluris]